MLFFVFFCLSLSVIINGEENPQVKISDGKLLGKILKSKEGREFSAFQGIPYAEPPLGKLRFKSPVPIKPWKDVLDATQPHAVCPQRDIYRRNDLTEGDEDCLYLNVYTPKLPTENTELLPVMVFFHGGGFHCGGGNSYWYGPDVLLDRDIVLVVTNYRLGALGFLSTGDEVCPGNYGMKDQSLALKWINRNIKHFGGDPESVTLFGESAGGASANYHMLSPLSKGLFKGVISQSGTAFCVWAHAPEGENIQNAKRLGEFVGCPTSSSEELVECLRYIDPLVLVTQDRKFTEWDNFDPMIPFKPVVEPPSPEAFLTDTPANLFKARKFQDVPWIVGVNSEDGLLRAAAFIGLPKLFDELNQDFNNKAAVSVMYKPLAENPDEVSERIRKFYFGNKDELNKENALDDLINMYTDGWFTKCVDDAVRIYLKVAKSPVYNYLFAHRSGVSFTDIFGSPGGVHGVCHADELQYLFPVADGLFPHKKITQDDKKITKLLTTMWENFAKTGNPTPETNELIKTKWEPIKSERLEYYHIDAKVPGMRDAMFEERVKFWRTLPLYPQKPITREDL